MILRRLNSPVSLSVLSILSLLVLAVGGFFAVMMAAEPTILSEVMSRREHDAIVDALKAQVGIIKWIGGVIVTSLAAAVAVLYRALEKANSQIRLDLRNSAESREKLTRASVRALEKMHGEIADVKEAVDRIGERVEQQINVIDDSKVG